MKIALKMLDKAAFFMLLLQRHARINCAFGGPGGRFSSMKLIIRLSSLAQWYVYQTAIPWWRLFRETRLYDFLAALPVIAWFGLSIANMISELTRTIARAAPAGMDLGLAMSILARMASIAFLALALVLLAVRRPPKAKAKGLIPRITAFAGTFMMVLIVWLEPKPLSLAASLLSVALSIGGMSFSIFALMHLGRSFSLMPEARGLVRDGPYAFIRHPLYLGEAVSLLGLVLQYLSPLAVIMFLLQFAFQLQRIENEERILGSLFPEYEAYRTHTAKLVPGLY